MPLTKQNIEQLLKLDTTKAPEGKRYLHGVVPGLDKVFENSQIQGLFTVEQDFTTYHAFIVPITPDTGQPLKKTFEDVEAAIKIATLEGRRLDSHITTEIENFIRKWLDSDFKFT